MHRLPHALLILPLLAGTAAATPGSLGTGPCEPHRDGEVRCAVRLDLPGGSGTYQVSVSLRGEAGTRAQADIWRSTCGTAEALTSTTNIPANGESRIGTFRNGERPGGMLTQAVFGHCLEVFLSNCTRDAERVACDRVIIPGRSSIIVR